MPASPLRRRALALALLLALATAALYAPSVSYPFIWDDDANVTENAALHDAEGLARLWREPDSMTQYYPLLYTTFWVEHALFGLDPAPYHVLNVAFHVANALLLWRILLLLGIPGAWLAAALFALHPVQVETVAWVTELKNLQSGCFYLAAAWAYLRWEERRGDPVASRRRAALYPLSLALFLCAVLSKTVTTTLPAALLLVVWWRRGRLGWRDALPLLPMLALLVPVGWLTVGNEAGLSRNRGYTWDPSAAERLLVAGRALCFYAGKLAWPTHLSFVYPRWRIDAGAAWQYAFPAAAALAAALLFALRRRIGRGPLVGLLYFAGTALPALGFLEIYYFRYSYAADHWQYLACIGLLALAAAGLARASRALGLGPRASAVAAGALLLLLGFHSARHLETFRDMESLWRATLVENPDSDLARYNLAVLLQTGDRDDEARAEYQELLARHPEHVDGLNNLGFLRYRAGDLDGAIELYRRAIELAPLFIDAHWNLGLALEAQGRIEQALAEYERALAIDPEQAIAYLERNSYQGVEEAHLHVAQLRARRGEIDQAIEQCEAALLINPFYPPAYVQLGLLLARYRSADEGIRQLQTALRLDPDNVAARRALEQIHRKRRRR